jgi:hypothetical protein
VSRVVERSALVYRSRWLGKGAGCRDSVLLRYQGPTGGAWRRHTWSVSSTTADGSDSARQATNTGTQLPQLYVLGSATQSFFLKVSFPA